MSIRFDLRNGPGRLVPVEIAVEVDRYFPRLKLSRIRSATLQRKPTISLWFMGLQPKASVRAWVLQPRVVLSCGVRLDDEFLSEHSQGLVNPVGGRVMPWVEHPAYDLLVHAEALCKRIA